MFSRETDKKIKRFFLFGFVWICLMILTSILAIRAYYRNIGFEPDQPVEFSHKQHYDKYEMKCIYCHYNAEHSPHSSLPTTSDCMVCHVALKEESELMKLVNDSYDSGHPIVWKRVYSLPDYVKFNHSRHIRAQIDCSSCHGDVENMDKIHQVRALNMNWCLDCHNNPAEYIIPARNISGILKSDGNLFNEIREHLKNQKPAVEPYYGSYIYDVVSPIIEDLTEPVVPGYGPANCSACHY